MRKSEEGKSQKGRLIVRPKWFHQEHLGLCQEPSCSGRAALTCLSICASREDVFISHMGELIDSLEMFRRCQASAWRTAEICYSSSVTGSCFSSFPNTVYPLTRILNKYLIITSVSPGYVYDCVLIIKYCLLLWTSIVSGTLTASCHQASSLLPPLFMVFTLLSLLLTVATGDSHLMT